MSRRNFLGLVAGTSAGLALAGCGSSGPSDESGGGGGGGAAAGAATYWFLTGPPGEQIRQGSVDRFNQANPDAKITATTFQNDAYKTKIKTAIGAGQAPTIIWGWGGGGLRSYVQASQVEDLTSWFAENAAVKDRLFPSSFGAATIDGKIYAMPAETVQPIVLYWNKTVFDKVGAQPPQSWGDIMSLVPKFNDAGVAPISLGGQSRWTNMMWLEFLFDRIGGPEVFQAVFDGEKDAWSNPASIEGLTKAQELIKANGFVKGFSSITADSNADQALLYTGKAAMMLHGTWTYGSMKRERWRLRQRRQPRLDELPGGRGRQGRPDQHGRQPRPVLLDLVQGHGRGEGDRQEVLLHRRALRRRGQGVDRQRRGADRQGHRQPARRLRRTPSSSPSSTTPPATPRSSPSPGTRPSAPPPPRSCSTTSPSSSSCRSHRSSSPPT